MRERLLLGPLLVAGLLLLVVSLLPAQEITKLSAVTLTSTATLTNKRVTPRVVTVTSAAALACNVDNADVCSMATTEGAGTLTLSAPSGTPTAMQPLRYRIKCTNAQTYAFNAIFRFSTSVVAPTTCVAGKTDYIGVFYNEIDTKYDVVAVDQGHS